MEEGNEQESNEWAEMFDEIPEELEYYAIEDRLFDLAEGRAKGKRGTFREGCTPWSGSLRNAFERLDITQRREKQQKVKAKEKEAQRQEKRQKKAQEKKARRQKAREEEYARRLEEEELRQEEEDRARREKAEARKLQAAKIRARQRKEQDEREKKLRRRFPAILTDAYYFSTGSAESYLVGDGAVPCYCPHCEPELYRTECHELFPQPEDYKTDLKPQHDKRYDGLDLTFRSIASVDRPKADLTETQTAAIDRFNKLWEKWSGPLGKSNAQDHVPHTVLCDFAQCLSDIFFHSSLPKRLACRWNSNMKGVYGRTWIHNLSIEIHPKEHKWKIDRAAASRMTTLLHECIHVYLESLSCSNVACSTYHHSIGIHGHGRAFTLLENRLLRRCPELLGHELTTTHEITENTIQNLSHHIAYYQTYPSRCDLHAFSLHDCQNPDNENTYEYLQYFDEMMRYWSKHWHDTEGPGRLHAIP